MARYQHKGSVRVDRFEKVKPNWTPLLVIAAVIFFLLLANAGGGAS